VKTSSPEFGKETLFSRKNSTQKTPGSEKIKKPAQEKHSICLKNKQIFSSIESEESFGPTSHFLMQF
jgi:hypothetical protein